MADNDIKENLKNLYINIFSTFRDIIDFTEEQEGSDNPYVIESKSLIKDFEELLGNKKDQMYQAIEDKLTVFNCKDSDWNEYKSQEDYSKIFYCMEMQAQVGLSVIDEIF